MSSSNGHDHSPHTYEPTSPTDLIGGRNSGVMTLPPQQLQELQDLQQQQQQQQQPSQDGNSRTRSFSEKSFSSLKSPRAARFAEATSVLSPVDGSPCGVVDPSAGQTQPQQQQEKTLNNVSDLGFGYVADNDPVRRAAEFRPPASPLKSALKSPGTARTLNPLSPTFREEYMLEKHEKATEKQNAKDLRVKTRVRLAKAFLRVVNFSCSMIVLSLLATTLTVFEATKSIPERNNLPPWAIGTNPWPQYLLLALAGVSVLTCLAVFWGYWKGGHKRAEKLAVYYSTFSVCYFVFDLIMWVVGAAVFENAKANGGGEDLWGWSCKKNERYDLFKDDVNYSLLCRLQDWGLVCAIIEVVIELFVILIYAVVFYRFYSKRRLMKTMDTRDRARSDLYLAQLRVQSAPNTPGFLHPMTPGYPPKTPKSATTWVSVAPIQESTGEHDHSDSDPYSAAENGYSYTVQYAVPQSPTRPPQAFHLQPPPIRVQHATPVVQQAGFAVSSSSPPPSNSSSLSSPSTSPSPPPPQHHQHPRNQTASVPASGEQSFGSVPIPGAY
ncbi:hypothetical protein ASPZODRAFT_146550 [Penicilliopsis zonata CBS 506.65]|uniref:MARVEL domain-containing protein n=1 Tax=Penicilliopsis zonata CBS 506.65 TaxID=1073090 RepID=A0A1L9S765_9EURO|nr:hypothetical protein ASPZODRAFT_146550 [Penicilliopsis zonata CBS 506.65]OJJ42990.1 hypothetical protein ASPZODRAFT_146550 [Penicilliopsis zonata CBS 506.65]